MFWRPSLHSRRGRLRPTPRLTTRPSVPVATGPEGKGDTALGKAMKVKDLATDDVQKQSDADLTGIIAKGKKPMLGYADKLTPEQIAGIVKYIRALRK